MRVTSILTGSIIAVAALSAAPALAVTNIANGTVAAAAGFVPTVTTGPTSTFSAASGLTFVTSGTGGFAGASGLTGLLNGTVSFSSTVGATIAQALPDFFVFNDGAGGTFNFSAASAQTMSYSIVPGVSSSFAVYLLGSTLDAFAGLGPTATSLTLTFNNTGSSAYSASATLAVPPSPITPVPEPASWALIVLGFGGMGAMLRRPRTSVSYS